MDKTIKNKKQKKSFKMVEKNLLDFFRVHYQIFRQKLSLSNTFTNDL